MHETATANGTAHIPVALVNGHTSVPNLGPVFTTERLKELVAAVVMVLDFADRCWLTRILVRTPIG